MAFTMLQVTLFDNFEGLVDSFYLSILYKKRRLKGSLRRNIKKSEYEP